jgi:hypothetical protein
MMQAGNGNEGTPAGTRHERLDGDQGCAHDGTGRVENTLKRGRVSTVQKALSAQGLLPDEFHVTGRVERRQLFRGCGTRRTMSDLARQPLRGQFPDETIVAIRSEGMTLAEPVAGNGFSGDDGDGRGHRRKG